MIWPAARRRDREFESPSASVRASPTPPHPFDGGLAPFGARGFPGEDGERTLSILAQFMFPLPVVAASIVG
jgi:hypothetical protein